jgi:hypothetical protein
VSSGSQSRSMRFTTFSTSYGPYYIFGQVSWLSIIRLGVLNNSINLKSIIYCKQMEFDDKCAGLLGTGYRILNFCLLGYLQQVDAHAAKPLSFI